MLPHFATAVDPDPVRLCDSQSEDVQSSTHLPVLDACPDLVIPCGCPCQELTQVHSSLAHVLVAPATWTSGPRRSVAFVPPYDTENTITPNQYQETERHEHAQSVNFTVLLPLHEPVLALANTPAEARVPGLSVIFRHSTCGTESTGTVLPALLATVLISGPRLLTSGALSPGCCVSRPPDSATFRSPGPGSSLISFLHPRALCPRLLAYSMQLTSAGDWPKPAQHIRARMC